jgi:hypothetical protein
MKTVVEFAKLPSQQAWADPEGADREHVKEDRGFKDLKVIVPRTVTIVRSCHHYEVVSYNQLPLPPCPAPLP